MRNRWNLVILALITALTVFSIFVVWPSAPKRYLPEFVSWPEGNGLNGVVQIVTLGLIDDTGDFERQAMRLGLDLNGGTHLLLKADIPPGVDPAEAMEGVKEVIERRVNAFGVSETEVTIEGKDRLAVQLPGIPPDEARELVGRIALLEFRQPVLDENLDIVCQAPDGSQFSVSGSQYGVVDGIDGERVAQCIGSEGEIGDVLWEPATGTDGQGEVRVLTGRFLRPNASVSADPLDCGGTPSCVGIEFSGDGGLLFQEITGRLAPERLPLGIFLDEELISAPRVQAQISAGQSIITGLDLDEARRLRVQLNAGALPVPLREIQSTEVDATLGQDTLVRSVQAGIIGILAVMAFMIVYYRLPGVLASLALITYISTVMMLFKVGPLIGPVTITLAGIAGLVLSVGMAVDANVLVFERMKEELRAGRNLAGAIEHGFDRAWSSIRASNVATLIICVILWWFGDQFGANLVKGFALTLGIGVIISMFSAIIVTRTLLRLLVGTPAARRLWLFAPDLDAEAAPAAAAAGPGADGGLRRGRRSPFMLDFVKRRRFYFVLSAVVLLPGVISLLIPPSLEPGIEFSSGATFTVQFDEDAGVTQAEVRDALGDLGHDEARVQRTSDGAFIVRTSALAGVVGPPVGPAPPSEVDTIREALIGRFGPLVNLNGEVTDSFQNFNSVSEIVSREIGRDAAIAVAAASVAILLYITYSFRNVPKSYRYGVAAIVAAMHDALFIVGAFSIFGKLLGTEVNTMFITGVLTIIGFSVHDTIVVFDRIRENVSQHPDVPFAEVVNASLTETLGRSLNTSVTLVFTIVSLLMIGGAGIDALLVVMLLGVIAGTYSSIFIASQLLIVWEEGELGRLYRRILPGRPVPTEVQGREVG